MIMKGIKSHNFHIIIEKLQARKKNAVELSKSVNDTKRQIDQLRTQVEECSKRRLETTGELVTDTGEVVMNEDEYLAIVELKKVKPALTLKFQSDRPKFLAKIGLLDLFKHVTLQGHHPCCW